MAAPSSALQRRGHKPRAHPITSAPSSLSPAEPDAGVFRQSFCLPLSPAAACRAGRCVPKPRRKERQHRKHPQQQQPTRADQFRNARLPRVRPRPNQLHKRTLPFRWLVWLDKSASCLPIHQGFATWTVKFQLSRSLQCEPFYPSAHRNQGLSVSVSDASAPGIGAGSCSRVNYVTVFSCKMVLHNLSQFLPILCSYFDSRIPAIFPGLVQSFRLARHLHDR